MHADLVLISNMWQADSSIDRLKAEFETLSQAVTRTTTEVEKLTTEQKTITGKIDALRATERAKTRELEDYQGRKAQTQRLIDSGTPNYTAAERQLQQCNTILDGLETDLLGLMDEIDTHTTARAANEKALKKAQEEQEAASSAKKAREPEIRATIATLLQDREAAWKVFPGPWQGHYLDLRRKKRAALVNVEEETCTTCRIKVPAQRIVEVQLDRTVHTCPGCLGFILP